ncbi:unnamed protein product [Acanthoscelides obtectus]|uniref:C2H2-type domain-containing protein n=1 Tax=Acanthoscelides obtectus TaxID=200917 RepID=A0A9P0LH26_ACAOB|nr:unnamed protein product [Acanthoscelides obtectus]CAK1626573.1 Zinc finger protein 142 [Acanthoscelides obtectus]
MATNESDSERQKLRQFRKNKANIVEANSINIDPDDNTKGIVAEDENPKTAEKESTEAKEMYRTAECIRTIQLSIISENQGENFEVQAENEAISSITRQNTPTNGKRRMKSNYNTTESSDYTNHWSPHKKESYEQIKSFFREEEVECTDLNLNGQREHVNKHFLLRYECILCNYVTYLETDLSKHIDTHVSIHCSTCEFQTMKEFFANDHLETPWGCSECGYHSHHWLDVNRHIFSRHRTSISLYLCELCSFITTNNEVIIKHKTVHKKYFVPCKLCDFTTKNTNVLDKHYENTHTISRESTDKTMKPLIKCTFCDCLFKHESFAGKHLALHIRNGPSYKCNKCNDFGIDNDLSTEDAIITCPYCDARRNYRVDIHSHILQCHLAKLQIEPVKYGKMKKTEKQTKQGTTFQGKRNNTNDPSCIELETTISDGQLEGVKCNKKTRTTKKQEIQNKHPDTTFQGKRNNSNESSCIELETTMSDGQLEGVKCNKKTRTTKKQNKHPDSTFQGKRNNSNDPSCIELETTMSDGQLEGVKCNEKTRTTKKQNKQPDTTFQGKRNNSNESSCIELETTISAGQKQAKGLFLGVITKAKQGCIYPTCVDIIEDAIHFVVHLDEKHNIPPRIIARVLESKVVKIICTSHYQCDFCPHMTLSEQDYTEHIKSHVIFKCEKCSLECTKQVFIDDHNEDCYTCEMCSFKAYHWFLIFKHMLSHERDTSYLTCEFCTAVAKSPLTIEKHRRVHEQQCFLRCQICQFQTKNVSSLEEHYIVYHETVSILENAAVHLTQSFGSESKPRGILNCAYCAYTDEDMVKMINHMTLTHNALLEDECYRFRESEVVNGPESTQCITSAEGTISNDMTSPTKHMALEHGTPLQDGRHQFGQSSVVNGPKSIQCVTSRGKQNGISKHMVNTIKHTTLGHGTHSEDESHQFGQSIVVNGPKSTQCVTSTKRTSYISRDTANPTKHTALGHGTTLEDESHQFGQSTVVNGSKSTQCVTSGGKRMGLFYIRKDMFKQMLKNTMLGHGTPLGQSIVVNGPKSTQCVTSAKRSSYISRDMANPTKHTALGHGSPLEDERHQFGQSNVVNGSKSTQCVTSAKGTSYISSDMSNPTKHMALGHGTLLQDESHQFRQSNVVNGSKSTQCVTSVKGTSNIGKDMVNPTKHTALGHGTPLEDESHKFVQSVVVNGPVSTQCANSAKGTVYISKDMVDLIKRTTLGHGSPLEDEHNQFRQSNADEQSGKTGADMNKIKKYAYKRMKGYQSEESLKLKIKKPMPSGENVNNPGLSNGSCSKDTLVLDKDLDGKLIIKKRNVKRMLSSNTVVNLDSTKGKTPKKRRKGDQTEIINLINTQDLTNQSYILSFHVDQNEDSTQSSPAEHVEINVESADESDIKEFVFGAVEQKDTLELATGQSKLFENPIAEIKTENMEEPGPGFHITMFQDFSLNKTSSQEPVVLDTSDITVETEVEIKEEEASASADETSDVEDFIRSNVFKHCHRCCLTFNCDNDFTKHMSDIHGSKYVIIPENDQTECETQTPAQAKDILGCLICLDTFDSNHARDEHMCRIHACSVENVEVEQKSTEGSGCRVTQENQQLLDKHMFTNHNLETMDEVMKVEIEEATCKEQYAHLKEVWRCNDCSFTGKIEIELLLHKAIMHAMTKRKDCPVCDYASNSLESLDHHLRTAHSLKRCKRDTDILSNSIPSFNQESNKWHCTECNYTADDEIRIVEHIVHMHKPKEEWICAICPYTATIDIMLEKHAHTKIVTMKPVKEVPPNKPNIQNLNCKFCNYKSTKSIYYLHKHLAIVHNINMNDDPDRKVPCKQGGCKFIAASIDELSVHMAEHLHNTEKKIWLYNCKRCGFRCSLEYIFNRHNKKCERIAERLRNTKNKVWRYNCEHCDFGCRWKKIFMKHIEKCQTLHNTKEKVWLYSCERCGFECSCKSTFIRHSKRCETNT